MPKGGSGNNHDDIPKPEVSDRSHEQVEKSSSQLQQNISSTDRQDHNDQETRVKEIRANKIAPTTAGRVIGGTPEIGHKFGDQKVFLEKNKVSAIEYPELDQVWQAMPDGKVQISRMDSHTGEKVEHVFGGTMSVEKSGDKISAINARLEFENGREVVYRNGSPTQIRHPDGEVWTRDAKDANVWHVAAHDTHHSGKIAHFDIHDVQVDAATGDIHWQVDHEGQNHLRRIDRNGQYADFAPGQPYTFVEDSPHSEKRQQGYGNKVEAQSISTPEQSISLSKLDKPPTPTIENIQQPKDYKVVRVPSDNVRPPADRQDGAKPFEHMRGNPAHLKSMEAFKEAIKSDLGPIPLRPKDQAARKTADEIQPLSYKKPEQAPRQNIEQTNHQRGGPVPFAPPPPIEGRPQQKDHSQRSAANADRIESKQAVEQARKIEDKQSAAHAPAADQQLKKSLQISEPPRSSGQKPEESMHSNPLFKVGAPPSSSESQSDKPSNKESQAESNNSILAEAQMAKSHQLIDPETGEIHIGKHTYSPEQIVAQTPGVVSDATPQRQEPKMIVHENEEGVTMGSRAYISRADGSVDQFDLKTKKYLGTAVDASGQIFHSKGSYTFEFINQAGDVNKLGTTPVKFVNLYKSSQDAVSKIETQSSAPAKATLTKMEPIAAPSNEAQNLEKGTKPSVEMQKLPMPTDQSLSDSAARAGELIRSQHIQDGVSEINKHLMDIEYSGGSSEQKSNKQWKYIQEAMSASNIQGTISGNFWIGPKNTPAHTIKLENTSIGDQLAGRPAQDRSKLIPIPESIDMSKMPASSGTFLRGSAQKADEVIPPKLDPSKQAEYDEYARKLKLAGDASKQGGENVGYEKDKIEWDKWNHGIQEYLQSSLTPDIKRFLQGSAGTISFNFDVSRDGRIYGISVVGNPRVPGLEQLSHNVINRMAGSDLVKFPQSSQKRMQHFSWSLAYGSNVRDGVNYQDGQDEIITRKKRY